MVNDMHEDNKKPLNPKREALILLSKEAFNFREYKIQTAQTDKESLFWESQTLNNILLTYFYETGGATEFNTFHQWKEKGATIVKNEKAFAIWGQPLYPLAKTEQEQGQTKEQEQERKYKHWPMCFLFSDKQVILPADRIPVRVDHPEQDQEEHETINLDSIL